MQDATTNEVTPVAGSVGTEERAAFVARYGELFEHSPWVAHAAWRPGGFPDADAMVDAMAQVVATASEADQLRLLCAHSELAGQEAASGTLTAASAEEQASAGLGRLGAGEAARLRQLNAAYREKHGFPFIICVRHYTKLGIFAELDRRTRRSSQAEREEAFAQVTFIARTRLARILADE